MEQFAAWKLACDLGDLATAARRFEPATRAGRFHKRSAWFSYAAQVLTIEIDRGEVQIPAAGTWPETVSIRRGDLYKLGVILRQKQGEVYLGFIQSKLRVVAPGLTWSCQATLQTPPASFQSDLNSTRLRRRKR
jgi:hypothetical protein